MRPTGINKMGKNALLTQSTSGTGYDGQKTVQTRAGQIVAVHDGESWHKYNGGSTRKMKTWTDDHALAHGEKSHVAAEKAAGRPLSGSPLFSNSVKDRRPTGQAEAYDRQLERESHVKASREIWSGNNGRV